MNTIAVIRGGGMFCPAEYVREILQTWGMGHCPMVSEDELNDIKPETTHVVLGSGPSLSAPASSALTLYVQSGGTAVIMMPRGELATAAGVRVVGPKECPLRLRMTGPPVAGVSGEALPVIGDADVWETEAQERAWGYLSHPGRYEGESVGIVRAPVGRGWIIALAFDLPRCVMLLRQGDPGHAERRMPGDRCPRTPHLAADIGPHDAGWIPFVDLLSRFLFDVVRSSLSVPLPVIGHLPATAPGLLLYSGDEDGATVEANRTELDYVSAAGSRMNLYIIPEHTESTPEDVARYAELHDLGPHPQLGDHYDSPVASRLAELERQIRLFGDRYGLSVRSVRNHSTAWAGYTEPAELMARLGVRMDANFFSGSSYMRERDCSPYGSFGSAVPMQFCRPDGRTIDVYQQPTAFSDDLLFGTSEYSARLSPEQFSVITERMFNDIATRFHTPFGVCIHPGNWVRFSARQGKDLLLQAKSHRMPVWSFDEWSRFWDRRAGWAVECLSWDGFRLECVLAGEEAGPDLCVWLPVNHAAASLTDASVDGECVEPVLVKRYREPVALVVLPSGATRVVIRAVYGTP